MYGADREFLDGFEEPGSGVVIRYVALYRLRASGDALTTTGNRLADDKRGTSRDMAAPKPPWAASRQRWQARKSSADSSTVSVWSFYVVDGRIAAGLLETKLLRARAVLLDREPVACLCRDLREHGRPKGSGGTAAQPFLGGEPTLPRIPRRAIPLNSGKITRSGGDHR